MVKKLVGPYVEILKAQDYSTDTVDLYIKNKPAVSESENLEIIKKDVKRSLFFDPSGRTHSDFVDECCESERSKECYFQGDFEGTQVVAIYDDHYKKELEEADRQGDNEKISDILSNLKTNQQFLKIPYRNDRGDLCTFGLVFDEKNPQNWILQISENITYPLESRKVTSYTQGIFATSKSGNDVELKGLLSEIKTDLNSEMLNKLITGLIDKNGVVSNDKYIELKGRFKNTSQNLDDRDNKLKKLNEQLIQIQKDFPNNSEVLKYFYEIKKQILTNVDFFKDENYDNVMKALKEKKESLVELEKVSEEKISIEVEPRSLTTELLKNSQEKEQINREYKANIDRIETEKKELTTHVEQNFLQRNRTTLIVGILAVVITSVFLLLPGVITSGLLALKLINDEIKFAEDKKQYPNDIKKLDSELEQCTKNYNEKINKHDQDLRTDVELKFESDEKLKSFGSTNLMNTMLGVKVEDIKKDEKVTELNIEVVSKKDTEIVGNTEPKEIKKDNTDDITYNNSL